MKTKVLIRSTIILKLIKRLWILSIVLLSVFSIIYTLPSQAQSRKSNSSSLDLKTVSDLDLNIESDSVRNSRRLVSMSFKQMGAWSAIKLRGVDGARTLAFPIRTDEVVVSAKLKLEYDYSPALIAELSHLKIQLNDKIISVESLPQSKGLANSREFNIDPRLFRDLNELRFTLIGHYTRECEDPFHSSLWLLLNDYGRLELTLAPIPTVNDLKDLPAPFFDKRDNVPLNLPFIFASQPSLGTLKVAGVLSSWFGQQAGVRGAKFPVSINKLPEGNGVLFLLGNESLQGIKGAAVSTVTIQTHPTNPNAKLLIVTGNNESDLMRAARTIALLSPSLSGQSVVVSKDAPLAMRKPYDAPAWIHTDRMVKFGEIAKPEELRVQGYFPEVVRLNYRVPPDLFTWRTPGVPVNLKYRASRLPLHHSSALNVNINNVLIDALPLNVLSNSVDSQNRLIFPKSDNKSITEASLFIPPYSINGRDQLQMAFSFDVTKEGACQNWPPDNLQAAIDSESTIDYSGFPHYVALPNLNYFSTLGFPFTRMADLSETAVVLPDQPNIDEISLYLVIMGRMGEATGYPSFMHEVITSAEVDKVPDRDFLVIGSSGNQKLMALWSDRMPMVEISGERRVREPNVSWRPTYRWEQRDIDSNAPNGSSMSLSNTGSLTTLMGFESPLKPSRSVVFVYADNSSDLRKVSDLITDVDRLSLIQGDFVVVDDKSIDFAKVSDTYYLGELPWISKIKWFLSDQPFFLALIVLLISVLLATIMYRPLRNFVAKRNK